ncbi:MAG: FAD-binding oxidoreductase [Gammaproteobacteria bacterium]|nr:FAD-binding oxidoreductase [Gammaproteobacteria bacterium]NIR83924.1 FAD-binding oxidoreductase [Gammaproteobacteria bacterium]NIR88919.1 FAD-binding oxidoreductase [Gammaproteobacteria bacterium]NIU04135.1 FAD-binding oxidoreductase [Gammaproteobacteria bacterium]NIV74150.1 FAD-dependent oxidoreductase [Gammaproteobacteria bacterium]
MSTCDFLIVGAGMAGASAGYELAGHGRVILLEREEAPGYHSTGRSAAQFLESYGNAAVRRLTHASRAFFEHPPGGFAEHALLTPRGALFVAREEQRETLEATLAEVQALVGTARELDAIQAIERVPVLRRDYVAAAFYEPDSMDMDVAAIHQGYLKGLRRRGGRVVTDAEVGRLSRVGQAWEVQTRNGRFSAPIVINAAGAWCDEIARLAGVPPLGLTPKRRTAITFDPPSGVDITRWPLVIDVDETFYFKPEAGRILASPADETPVAACDVQPEELDIAVTVDRLEKATTLSVRRIAHKWAGLRTFSPDKTPVVGMEEAAPGFVWLAGQGGYGITTAPALARATSALLVEGRLPEDLVSLGLTREALAPSRLR